LIKPKGKIISKIYVGKRKKGVRIVLYAANRHTGFKYRIDSKGEYLIITCWPKGKKISFKKGQYMPLPEPKKALKKLLVFKKGKKANQIMVKTRSPNIQGRKSP